ncbi:MAG: type II secretion system protein [Campylobacterales bacterium]
MKKSAFTMIELIFVIVILGILAAVAVPRLAGVQDDALGATEKSTVGAMRGGVQALYGKIMMKNGEDLNVTALTEDGTQYTIEYLYDTEIYNRRPIGLSSDGNSGTTSPTQDSQEIADETLAAVIDPGSDRDKWRTDALTGADENKTQMVGPASNTVDAGSDAEYTKAGRWVYNPAAGSITWEETAYNGN